MPTTGTFLQLHNFHAQHTSIVKNPALPTENFQRGDNGNFAPKAEYFAIGTAVTGIHDLEKSGPI